MTTARQIAAHAPFTASDVQRSITRWREDRKERITMEPRIAIVSRLSRPADPRRGMCLPLLAQTHYAPAGVDTARHRADVRNPHTAWELEAWREVLPPSGLRRSPWMAQRSVELRAVPKQAPEDSSRGMHPPRSR